MLDLVVLLFWLNWAAPAPPPAPAPLPAVATLDPGRKLSKAEIELGKALEQIGKDIDSGNIQKLEDENAAEESRNGGVQ